MPDWLTSILLGIIEGITEFLPISSTGHLLLTQQLGWLKPQSDTFIIAIQSGAVLAVLFNFTDRVKQLTLRWHEPGARDYLAKLLVAFAITGAGGLAIADAHLRGPVGRDPERKPSARPLWVAYADQGGVRRAVTQPELDRDPGARSPSLRQRRQRVRRERWLGRAGPEAQHQALAAHGRHRPPLQLRPEQRDERRL